MKKLASLVLALVLCLTSASALADGIVNVFNWEEYICEDVLKMFTEETGIQVNYMNFTTNEDMMIQVRANPSAFDVVFPSEYCVERMIAEGLLAPIDYDNVPEMKNTLSNLLNPAYDPENAHSVPYMWGTVGILYNTELVSGDIDSFAALFDEQYKGSVFMLDSIRDSMGITLKYLGHSMNTRDPFALEAAKELLVDQKQRRIVKAYQVDETKDKMILGEAALAVVWSGDAQYAIDHNPALKYVIPKEGSNVWVDCMVIPAQAKNKENAEAFINFMCRPDIAALNCEEIRYSSPNAAAIEIMGAEYIDNPTMNPTDDMLKDCEYFLDIQDFIAIYNALWTEVKNTR